MRENRRSEFQKLVSEGWATRKEAAKALECTPAHVTMVMKGTSYPGPRLMQKLRELTAERKNESPPTDQSHDPEIEELLQLLSNLPREKRRETAKTLKNLLTLNS